MYSGIFRTPSCFTNNCELKGLKGLNHLRRVKTAYHAPNSIVAICPSISSSASLEKSERLPDYPDAADAILPTHSLNNTKPSLRPSLLVTNKQHALLLTRMRGYLARMKGANEVAMPTIFHCRASAFLRTCKCVVGTTLFKSTPLK